MLSLSKAKLNNVLFFSHDKKEIEKIFNPYESHNIFYNLEEFKKVVPKNGYQL